ncbi:MAG: fatty acid desaturase [Planctomycetes bacterium]|nr:fatty acid desaturase [Planctomycetota bacterium]
MVDRLPAPAVDRARVREWPHALWSAAHVAGIGLCVWSWSVGAWPAAVLCWPVLAWLHHAALARLHEAGHSMLSRSRTRNELWGVAIGTLSLTPLSVYRYVHARHHAHLGDAHDPEFWPYNRPETSRARRLAYAWAELLFGFVVTPALYSLRTLRAWPRHRAQTQRRLLLEWSLLIVLLLTVVSAVWRFGWWGPFAVGFVIPGWLTGLLQTVRKFAEHLGLASDAILMRTRTVVYEGRVGRLLSASQIHVELHGTHHRWPKVPWRDLPAATAALARAGQPVRRYRSHVAAVREALRHLRDPRVGRQWLAAGLGAGMQT